MKNTLFILLIALWTQNCYGQNLEPFEITEVWLNKIEQLAPAFPRVAVSAKKKILVFSKATGYYHWTIPHNIAMLKILAKKSNAFEIHVGYDIGNFAKKQLRKYDAVILNNSNPKPEKRDLFLDLLQENTSFSDVKIADEARKYEQNLIEYVSKGGGLILLHGGIVVQNNSMEFSKMTGGSFDYHPIQQQMHLKEVDKDHPLVKAFKGKGFVHTDEPYFFKNAYFEYNFRPLLYIETDQIAGKRSAVNYKKNYVAWIKKHGKGRVFYTSASHNPQSFEKPELLQFFLDGIQYVTGDLECTDSPMPGIGSN